VVLPALVFAPVWWRERLGAEAHGAKPARTLRVTGRDVALGALAFAVVGLPWYLAMTMTHGRAYLESFFLADNLKRFATDRFNEPRSPFFYVPVLLGGLLPWTAYLVAVIWRPVRDLFARRLVLTDAQWRLLLWAGMPLLFLSLSIGKQPRYVLPILPPVAILVAHGIVQRIEAARTGQRSAIRDLRAATIATSLLFLLVAALIWRSRELFITVSPVAAWAAIVALCACAIALAVVSRPSRLDRLYFLMPACAAIMLVALEFGVFAGRRPEPVEEVASLVRKERTANERVGVYDVFGRNLVFYLGFKQDVIGSEQHAADFLRVPDRVMLVVRDADLPKIEAAAGIRVRRLGEVRYFNTGNIKLRSLLVPDPEREIQRVVLVSNR
jgi:4-amino-4-deoxy-L-arabinose transferase-like glycosyltransferase